MGKPVERQNLSLPFFVLSTLIAICTAWAFYDEFISRRPWKDYQAKLFAYDRERLQQDLRYYERKLERGDVKVVPDASKPDQVLTLAEARARLEGLAKELARDPEGLRRLELARRDAQIAAGDADLKVKMLKSEDDGLFYSFQHAQHEEAVGFARAAKLSAQGRPKEAAEAEVAAQEHRRHREELEAQRAKKREEIGQAEREAAAAAAALAGAEAAVAQRRGAHDHLKAAIDAALEQVHSAKAAVEEAARKPTELTQYWLTSYDRSVDRCQNCHASIERCGFSRPHEVLAALAAPDAVPAKVAETFCVNPDTLEAYRATAEAVCGLEWDAKASAAGSIAPDQGVCLGGPEERRRVGEFLANHCGPQHAGVKLLADAGAKAACLGTSAWGTLASYVQDPRQRQAGGERWSACDLKLAEVGESCVEGAARDQLLLWLRARCPETSSTVEGLARLPKACGAGEDGKHLSQVRPVLFDLPVWAQAHPHRQELLGPHPPDRYGCTSCHEGQGAQTKGVSGKPFAHGWDDHYWERPLLDLIAHEKFRPKSFGAPSAKEGVPGEWVTHQRHFREASCAKCHGDEVTLKFAPTYSRGRKLVAEIGCHGCHPVDAFASFPKLGPTLKDLRRKTAPAFLVTWIAYPKAFRPRTKMPNFWPEALDAAHRVRAGSPEHALRTDEVGKISAYLWKSSSEDSLPPVPMTGDPERGRQLVETVGCRACHAFSAPDQLCTPEQLAAGKTRGTAKEPGECEAPRPLTGSSARDFAPNLSNIALKTNDRWLFAWLKDPTALWPSARMPNLRLADQEAADLTAYLMTKKEGPPLEKVPAYFGDEASKEFEAAAEEGGKLVGKYGCAGCHDIRGHENDPKIGTDLNEYGRKTADLLDFGNAIPNPRHQNWFNFVDLKLRAPRAYRYERVDTRMPQFDFDDDEVAAVMTFLKAQTAEQVPAPYRVAMNERLTALAKLDQHLEYYNCRGCHVVDGEGGRIRDVYLEDDLWKAPPLLQAQGWRVQPGWFFGFLKDPSRKLRPWLDVRMPTFPVSDQAATEIVRGFSAGSRVPFPYVSVAVAPPEGKQREEVLAMVAELRCFACHTSGEPAPGQDRSSLAPDLQLAAQRLRPDWVLNWVKNPQSLQEGTRMPSFFSPDDLGAVMYPKYFGGSQQKQIEMLRDYVMTLAQPEPKAAGPARRKGGGGAGSR